MKKTFLLILVLSAATISNFSYANQAAYDLGVCMSDSLTGKERKLLARWIFFGISTHSTIQQFSNIEETDRVESDQFLGQLITRLLTSDCPNQAKSAMDSGAEAFEQAFKVIGEVAMMEIMAEPAVSQSLGSFEKYMDESAFEALQ